MMVTTRSLVLAVAFFATLVLAPITTSSAHSLVTYDLAYDVGLEAAPAPARTIANPYAVPGAFRKAQLHLHTSNSFDGHKEASPAETARAFKAAGYGFIVFTDHDTLTVYHGADDATFAAGTGYESTGGDGHLGALFVTDHADARMSAQRRIDAIRRNGGLVSANHPDYSVGFRADQLLAMRDFQLVEIYNQITTDHGGKRAEHIAENLQKWTRLINAREPGKTPWGIGVSDTHEANTGGGWTCVKTAQVTMAALRQALERGSAYASTGADFAGIETEGETIRVRAAKEGRIRFVDQDGRIVAEELGDRAAYRVAPADRWIRIELLDKDGGEAWSQPLWIS
jgi:hypothetical protein